MPTLDDLLVAYVEHRLRTGEAPAPEILCADDPEMLDALRKAIQAYEQLDATMTSPPRAQASATALPDIEGFRVVERIGSGGGGDVFKVEDTKLGRLVAAKTLRLDRGLHATVEDFLREARALALFDDPRIVRLFEIRADADPPVLLMEYVDGFELGAIGHSLEYQQRAKIMAEVAEAVEGAHRKGLQHRDLKPANILVDRDLKPRLLDFGLSTGEPFSGHGRGTPAYMAPEQLETGRPLDQRTDVYSLGVVLYELLCGVRPFEAESIERTTAAILEGSPRLPVEIEPSVPEPLQAIALKAMERDPSERYSSAGEMALDLRRFLQQRPVLARPSLYHIALSQRIRDHLEQIREWLALKLVYAHEAERLDRVYRQLESREDDWILHSRLLSWSQIVLYLGACLLLGGGLFFFSSYVLEAVEGVVRPLVTLGLPILGLGFSALLLLERDRRSVAVAFFLAATTLLPLALLILLREGHLLAGAADSPHQLFDDGWITNRQLQLAFLVAALCALWLGLRTRTLALATLSIVLVSLFHLGLLTDLGLRRWFEEGLWDRLAFGLAPLLLVFFASGAWMEKRRRPWFASPGYFAVAVLFVAVLELLTLNGRLLAHVGLTLAGALAAEISDPTLLDTVVAMVFNGGLIYLSGWLMERFGSPLMRSPAAMLCTVAPFAILEPVFYLNHTAEYSVRFCWLYLVIALGITALSHFRQRKTFYLAGLTNTGAALWQITSRNEWWDNPTWATVVIAVGLAVLAGGFGLDSHEETHAGPDGCRRWPVCFAITVVHTVSEAHK